MFGFLRKKLKNVVSKVSEEVEETVADEEQPEEEKQPEPVQEETTETKETKPKKTTESKPKKPSTPSQKNAKKKQQKTPSPKEKQPESSETEAPESIEKPKEEEEKEKVQKADEPLTEETETKTQKGKEQDNQPEEKKKKKGFVSKLFSKKEHKTEESPEEHVSEETEEKEKEQAPSQTHSTETKAKQRETEEETPAQPEKKGIFKKVQTALTTKTLSMEKFEEIFMELEMAMLENNVALEVIDKIKEDLRNELVDKRLPKGKIDEKILLTLKNSLEDLFSETTAFNLIDAIEAKKEPYVICFVGVNGSGKTTAVAKIAHMLLEKGHKPVMTAADTFRAAAIQQLEEHANKLDVMLIKHDYGSDPAAVAYDAIEHAKAKGKDVVLIDTSGRLHSNVNLMNELHKIQRVAKPDLTVFVGESITGNDCVEQAKTFDEIVGFDGIILTKADIDEKGGAFISVSYVTKKPILFVGTGQRYQDIKGFDKDEILAQIGL
jgi:fused signal recognition particle receptor